MQYKFQRYSNRTALLISLAMAIVDLYAIVAADLLHGFSSALANPFVSGNLTRLLPILAVIVFFWFGLINVLMQVTYPSKIAFGAGVLLLLALLLSIPGIWLLPDFLMDFRARRHLVGSHLLRVHFFVLIPLLILLSAIAAVKTLIRRFKT